MSPLRLLFVLPSPVRGGVEEVVLALVRLGHLAIVGIDEGEVVQVELVVVGAPGPHHGEGAEAVDVVLDGRHRRRSSPCDPRLPLARV